MSAARKLLTAVDKKFPTLPFSLRSVPGVEVREAQLGVTECVKVNSLASYPVMQDRPGTHTASVSFTVLLLPGGTLKLTGLPPPGNVLSERALPAELAAVRALVPYVKPAKGGGGGGGGGAAGSGGGGGGGGGMNTE